VVLCVGYLGEQIRDFVGDGAAFGLEVDYSWDGPVALGTAGALRRAMPKLGEAFFAMYGDSYLPCDFGAVEDAFRTSGKLALMTVFHNAGKWDSSNVELGEGRILAYNKERRTARMCHIDYGLGVFKSSVFNDLPDKPCDLATIYQDLLLQGKLAAFEVAERFYEAGSFEGIRSLSGFLAITDKGQVRHNG
jgi:NDP-sugar pyrophosphorylase family protein